jgi:hypothetical protein
MISAQPAPTLWRVPRCSYFSPAVYRAVTVRCNHDYCVSRTGPLKRILSKGYAAEAAVGDQARQRLADDAASGDDGDLTFPFSQTSLADDDGDDGPDPDGALAAAEAAMQQRDAEEEAARADIAASAAAAAETQRQAAADARALRQREAAERAAAGDAERDARETAEADQLAQQERDAEEQDSDADAGAYQHLVMLRNQPGVFAGVFSPTRFRANGVDIRIAGNGRMQGLLRADTLRHDPLTTYVLVLVDSVTIGADAGLSWTVERELPRTPLVIMAVGTLRPAIVATAAPSTAGTLTGAVRTITTTLPPTVQVVPNLNPYIQIKGVPLLLEADCATQKSRHIFGSADSTGWLYEMLRFNPGLRVMIVSCRIVHAIDVQRDLAPLGFELYSERGAEGSSDRRIVCQLNSIVHYTGSDDYDVVILDEVVSILSYFALGNHTLTARDGNRRTHLQHVSMMERLCRQAGYVIMADAHLSMDGRVNDFVDGVFGGRTVRKLVMTGKNPACHRTLRITYSNAAVQTPQDVSAAAAAVLENPELRIAVCSGSKKLLADGHREHGSYAQSLRSCGVGDSCMVHGELGDVEKKELFQNLADRVRSCQAFLANCTLTDGVNPTDDFGKVFAHVHRNGATVRDLFQLMQHFGCSATEGRGKLHDTVIDIVVNDKSPAAKQADRNAALKRGEEPRAPPSRVLPPRCPPDGYGDRDGQRRAPGQGSRRQRSGVCPAPAGAGAAGVVHPLRRVVSVRVDETQLHAVGGGHSIRGPPQLDHRNGGDSGCSGRCRAPG